MSYFEVKNDDSEVVGIIEYNGHTRPTMAALAQLIRDEFSDHEIIFLPNLDFTKIIHGNVIYCEFTLGESADIDDLESHHSQIFEICETWVYKAPIHREPMFDYSGFSMVDESQIRDLMNNLFVDYIEYLSEREGETTQGIERHNIDFYDYCTDGVDSDFKFCVKPSTMSHPPQGLTLEEWTKQNES